MWSDAEKLTPALTWSLAFSRAWNLLPEVGLSFWLAEVIYLHWLCYWLLIVVTGSCVDRHLCIHGLKIVSCEGQTLQTHAGLLSQDQKMLVDFVSCIGLSSDT